MTIVLPKAQRRPSFGDKLNVGIGRGLEMGSQLMAQKQQQQQQQQMTEKLSQLTGMDLNGLSPEMLQDAAKQHFQSEREQKLNQLKGQQNVQMEGRDYDVVKNTFGEKFANIWKASPVGGRTELLKHAIDATTRGENMEQLLQGVKAPEQVEKPQMEEKLPQMKKGQISPEFKWPNYTKRPQGYTAKEWTDSRKEWRKENVPIFEQNNAKLDSTNADILATKKLESLSDKLPEGLERVIINPETGELYGLAQLAGLASPEVQEWVKTISRFQNRAKDSFGSRVTNFDLMSYMKQFPGLMNTKEGRKRILRMMSINYDLDKQYQTALQKVYQHYGLNGIPQEESDRLARGMIEDETDRLKTEYLGHEAQNQQMQNNQNLSGKMLDVIGPDGNEYEIDESELDQLPEGFRIK